MSKDLTKKAAEMLLNGATLLAEPCPYCRGVRVMKDGGAFCVNCGKEPQNTGNANSIKNETPVKTKDTLDIFEKKLEDLSKELELEVNHEKQQQILKSVNSLIEIISKLKSKE